MNETIRVLYAEHDPRDADLTRISLQNNAPDLTIEIVSTAHDFRLRLKQRSFDVLLLDQHLPDADGAQVLGELVREGLQQPVVMVTGPGDETLVVHTLRLGASDYLTRSGDYLQQLPAVLRAAVAEFRKRQELELAQERLREIEERYRVLTRNIPNGGVFLFDQELRYTLAEGAGLKAIGLSPEFLVGKTIREALPSDTCHILEPLYRAALAGEAIITELPFADRIYSVHVLPIRNESGRVICGMAMAQNITERKRVEEALGKSEERYRTFLRLSAEGVSRWEHDVPIPTDLPEDEQVALMFESAWLAECNDAYAQMCGFKTANDLVGIRLPDLFPPSDPGIHEFLRLYIHNGYRLNDIESSESDHEGRVRSILHNLVGVVENGLLLGSWGTQRDISDRKRLEAQLLQSQKMEGIGRLAGGIAHDFNNLLTAILGYTELAGDQLASDDPIHEYLEPVRTAAERAANLTGQLLAFARKQIIAPKVVDLNALVLDTDKLLRRLIGTDIELVTLPDAELGRVKVDPGQFEQILVNLAINARDAMPGGGKLTIETNNVTLDADYTHVRSDVAPGDYVMLAVSDTGLGMDETVQEHIFEPFFTTKERGRGTGLGLATCHGIVKQSGGHIWLYSEPGKGTTFKIYLPRVREDPPAPIVSAIVRSPRGTETILLVEDEPMVRRMAATALQAQGYTLLEAGTGDEALALAQKHPGEIDMLLTDIVMPQMSGKQLAERLLQARPGVKILYASGYTENTIVHHGVLDAGVAFLQKPYSPGVLAHRVRETLDVQPQQSE